MDAIFNIAGQAMTAQSQRLNTVASNLANAESTVSSTGGPYRAKQVVFSAVPMEGAAAGVKPRAVSSRRTEALVLEESDSTIACP